MRGRPPCAPVLRAGPAGGVQGAGDDGLSDVQELAVLLAALGQASGDLVPGETSSAGEGGHRGGLRRH
ncbi:hypothetical protein [Streptomyces nojiriensis]|uniref:hypothetical protein n=1 Tax=Streptomyces nojiriensis TaxID=66374 RepID=UPI003656D080